MKSKSIKIKEYDIKEIGNRLDKYILEKYPEFKEVGVNCCLGTEYGELYIQIRHPDFSISHKEPYTLLREMLDLSCKRWRLDIEDRYNDLRSYETTAFVFTERT